MRLEAKKSISVVWTVEDVQSEYENLTAYEAGLVLSYVEEHHDANVGINWDVIADAARAVVTWRAEGVRAKLD